MISLLTDLARDGTMELAPFLGSILSDFVKHAFYPETFMGSVANTLTTLYWFFYLISFCSLALKFIKKGFFTYILWRDGDADDSPINMMSGAILALSLALCFNELYDWFAEFSTWLVDTAMNILGTVKFDNLTEIIASGASKSFLEWLFQLVYLIFILIVWGQFLMRGIELLCLRIGFPFAVSGLIDSDDGIFKPYIKIFVQNLFTSLLQGCLLIFAQTLFSTANIIYAIVVLISTTRTPKMLQQLLLMYGGGGGISNKITATSSAIRIFNMFRGKGA